MKPKILARILRNTCLSLGWLAMAGGAIQAQTVFTPGHLAVLQLGDGGPGRCLPLNGGSVANPYTSYDASDVIGARQTAMYIDQFDPNGINQTVPAVQIAVPTNGADGLFVNGNAGTEGTMTLAGDKSRLAVTGYAGDLLSITTGQQTAPSNLSYDRGIGTIDAFGNYVNIYRGGGWYGIATGKTNPRGVATDGAGNFWGCGNGFGSLFFNAGSAPNPIQFQNIALTSCSKVINNILFATVKNSEAVNLYPAGIYSFVDFYNNPVPYPNAASFLHLEIPANPAHNNCIGFDINPQGNVAYLADATVSAVGGLTKYVKTGLTWSMAYHLAIPGYTSLTTGIMTNAGATNQFVGCFSVAVDWSGTNPVVYATTGDSGFAVGSPYYGNRVIRINDTNTTTAGITIIATTNILTTVVKPPGTGTAQLTNVVFKSVTFTPDLRPVITNQPANWAAVVSDNVSFNLGASSPFALNYQWLRDGTNLTGETSSTLTLNSVGLPLDTTTYQCVVSNDYGAVTSSIATLAVSPTPIPLSFGALQNLTNNVGNNQSITADFTAGTDPKSGYQWYLNGSALADGPTGNGATLAGTTSGTLSITQLGTNDAGVYSLVATNIAGSASNAVANLVTTYAAPVMIQPPSALTTFFGRTMTNPASAYGQLLSYKWYTSTNKAAATPTGLTLLTDAAEFSGTTTPSLIITGVTNRDATNYVIVISNPGGSITSAPVTLTVLSAPPHSFVNYTNAGQVYAQNFDSLPIPGLSSAEGANPLHITYVMTNIAGMLTNGNPASINNLAAELQYSTDSPLDFGYPILPAGSIGGLGLSNTMGGWYGWAQNALVFAATKGDQSQGAVVDNGGNYYADGTSLAIVTNRALGMIATVKSGAVSFGAAFVNKSTSTCNVINLSYTGELWRNNPAAQPLIFGYFIDDAGTNSTFQPAVWDSTNGITYIPSLNVSVATSGSTLIFDGTQASNQISYAVSLMTITNWPPGATLWLTWQAQTLGSAQNLAIDNLSFAAGLVAAPAVTTTPASALTQLAATINANVTPNTLATTSYFEYGATASYGSFTTTNSVGSGLSPVAASRAISGLQPGTTYHYRAVANNSLGTTLGADAMFTTTPITRSKLDGVSYGPGGLQFSFTNTAGVNFTVLGSTNVTVPLTNWQVLGAPIEGPAGQYHFTDPTATNKTQLFYILRQP